MSPETPARRPVLALALVAAWVAVATPAFPQTQDKDQQKCLIGMGKSVAGVSVSQGKENFACLSLVGKGRDLPGGSAQACLSADPKSKVSGAMARTVATDTNACTVAPDFGYQAAATANDAARSKQLSLVADLFGTDLGAAAIPCATDKAACSCQSTVLKSAEASAAAKFKTYLACEKAALSAGADAAADLVACVNDEGTPGSVAADTKGKLAKADARLEDMVVKKCLDASLVTDTLFPGECVGRSGDPAFADCIDDRIECRVCQSLNRSRNLGVDCDLFDDEDRNASCVDFGGSALFSVAAGYYAGLDSMTLQLAATDALPVSAGNYFELVSDGTGAYRIRSVGNGSLVRANPMDSFVYADSPDDASATSWVIFIESGSGTDQYIFIRSAPPTSDVDALVYDSASERLKLVTAPLVTVVTEDRFRFRFGD